MTQDTLSFLLSPRKAERGAAAPPSLGPAVLELHVPDQIPVAVRLVRAERAPVRLEARVDPQVALQVVPFREYPSAQPALVPAVCGVPLRASQTDYAYRRRRRNYRRPCCSMCPGHVRLEPLQTKTQCSLYTFIYLVCLLLRLFLLTTCTGTV